MPKFKIGQLVTLESWQSRTGDVYQITRILPEEQDGVRYRIKSSREPHERVVLESQLEHRSANEEKIFSERPLKRPRQP